MDQSYLDNYHHEQMDIVLRNKGSLLKQGRVKHYKDIYPDIYKRLKDGNGIGYIRGQVPLKAMVLIYDIVIVSIPPLSIEQIEKRFSVTYEELIRLCNSGLVIPIITDTHEYSAPHFDDLFNLLNPPCSLWARGLGLLSAFNMDNALEIAKEALPVSEIANDQRIYSHWERRLLTDNDSIIKSHIENNVATLYADLCIFGFEEEARKLSDKTPSYIYNRLKKMNEISTYPLLFGMGSQPNYSTFILDDIKDEPSGRFSEIPVVLPERDLKILFEGIGINIDNVSVDDIISYHQDNLGVSLRNALKSFNEEMDNSFTGAMISVNPLSLYTKAEIVQSKVEGALRDLSVNNYSKYNDVHAKMTNMFKIGSVSIGILTPIITQHPELSVIFGSAGVATQLTTIPEDLSLFIMKMGISGLKSKFAANMWIASRKVHK